jgi:hypothetical protein
LEDDIETKEIGESPDENEANKDEEITMLSEELKNVKEEFV